MSFFSRTFLFLLMVFGLVSFSADLRQGVVIQFSAEHSCIGGVLPALPEDLCFVRTLSERSNIHLFDYVGKMTREQLRAKLQTWPSVKGVQWDAELEFRATPDDPLYARQWGLEEIGLPDVWETNTGGLTAMGDTIVLAIVDSGFDTDHVDMDGQIWINHGEIPGNGKDDDQNGYVDDYMGWSFDTDSPVHLPDNHGQSVAGIAGARGDNNTGVCGVNWNIKLMLLSVSTIADVISAYDYITFQRQLYNETGGDSGAFIVATNASFGVNRNAFCSEFPLWGEMLEAMGQVGVLTAAGTSNRSVDIDQVGDTPSGCPSDFIISTLNLNSSGQKGATSSFGKTGVDLGTPGDGSYTTKPYNLYGSFGQNSAAAPHLTGAIGLLYAAPCAGLAQNALSNPAETALQIKDWILSGVKPNSNLDGITVTGGVLDVAQSFQLVLNSCDTNTSNLEISKLRDLELFPNPVNQILNIRLVSETIADGQLDVFNETGQLVLQQGFSGNASLDVSDFLPGLYLIRVREGVDSWTEKVMILR